MDTTVEFFATLKKLAVTLESETDQLQQRFENRKSEDDTDTTATAVRAYHEVNCDISNLKGQIQEQLAEQKAKESEVSSFIKEYKEMQEKISQDIHRLKEHWEKYGYQAPKDAQKVASTNGHESAADDENEAKMAGGEEEESDEDARAAEPTSPLLDGPPPVTDVLRTPQLSDFGLSELFLKKGLARSERCPEEPPMPQISLPQPFKAAGPPPMPVTPKCALWLDDDEPQTPKLHEFAISEPTLCLLNDFTMDLFKKNVEKLQRPEEDIPAPVNPLMDTFQLKDNLDSPEIPEFYNSGFNFKKGSDPSAQTNGKHDSPERCGEMVTTPEIPALKNPYLKHLISAKKGEPILAQAGDDDGHLSDLLTPPRVRTDLEEPKTPDMPELSSITQDICKLLSQAQLKKAAMTVEQPNIHTDKIVPQKTVCLVSDSEFQSLPDYLKRMTVHNLNQAIHNINAFMAHNSGEKAEFQVEELQRIISAGPKTPIYILCLTELKRLTHVGGVKNASVYKLITHN